MHISTLFLVILLALTVALIIYQSRHQWEPSRPNLSTIPAIRAEDRILILAPHEDDEALGAGGLIQKAVAAGAAIRVAYLTQGDHNQLAFIVYRKRPWLSPRVNVRMGEIRRREAIEAMAYLGVSQEHLVFLGFPDHDTLSIFEKHWGSAPPLHSILTDTTRVPYRQSPAFDSPYKGESILEYLTRQLAEFHPTHILVTNSIDSNPDHRAYYLFLQVALLNSYRRERMPYVYTYPIHMGPWPRPHDYHPDEWLAYPLRLAHEQRLASSLPLTPWEVQKKYQAICMYRSQMSDAAHWLTAFARRNEIFIRDEPLALSRRAGWSSPVNSFASANTKAYETEEMPAGNLAGVSYKNSTQGLMAKVRLQRGFERAMGFSLCAFGYRHDTPFDAMPKLRIGWAFKQITVHDQEEKISPEGITVDSNGKEVILTIPWSMLGNPEWVFVHAGGLAGGLPISLTGWQILALVP